MRVNLLLVITIFEELMISIQYFIIINIAILILVIKGYYLHLRNFLLIYLNCFYYTIEMIPCFNFYFKNNYFLFVLNF